MSITRMQSGKKWKVSSRSCFILCSRSTFPFVPGTDSRSKFQASANVKLGRWPPACLPGTSLATFCSFGLPTVWSLWLPCLGRQKAGKVGFHLGFASPQHWLCTGPNTFKCTCPVGQWRCWCLRRLSWALLAPNVHAAPMLWLRILPLGFTAED